MPNVDPFRHEDALRWNSDRFSPPPAAMRRIAQRLVEIADGEVVWIFVDDDELRTAEERLEVFGPTHTIDRGEVSQCHYNSSLGAAKGLRIATGWAYSSDHLWRQHSWNIDEDGNPVETTEYREAYAGVILTDEETARFCLAEGTLTTLVNSDPERWVDVLRRIDLRRRDRQDT